MFLKILTAAFAICSIQTHPINERIIGGSDAKQGQFPYQALIRQIYENGGKSFCGGVLIDAKWILTAAHCIIEPDPVGFEIHLGSIYFDHIEDDTNRLVAYATNRIVHHGYYDYLPIYDIALIELPHAIEFNKYIQPVKLPPRNSGNFVYENSIASGWGYIEHDVNMAAERLQYASHIVMPNEECGIYWFWPGFVPEESIICAMGPKSEGICHGDSGGPLVTTDRETKILIGITNFRHYDACGVGPGGFARVSAYLDWIAEHTGLSV